MTRSERWSEPFHFPLSILRSERNPKFAEAVSASPELAETELTTGSLVGQSRELILARDDDGSLAVQFVGFSIDAATGTLMLAPTWRTVEIDDKELRSLLSAATLYDVPVYPDRDDDAALLGQLWASLRTDGVVLKSEKGKDVRLVWTREPFAAFDETTEELMVRPTETYYPGDAANLIAKVRERENAFSEARRILDDLRESTDGLAALLKRTARDENALQRFLTHHPLLFGLQYKRVVPKYRLGSDYELDYALETASGLVDLVEIEASTHKLFTRAGNPSKELVHAEQQVLDWLDWTEANARLARDDLPGMIRPVGQVVIGTRESLSDDDRRRLLRRNATWHGTIQVLTFDDLLDRAHGTLRLLTSNGERPDNA